MRNYVVKKFYFIPHHSSLELYRNNKISLQELLERRNRLGNRQSVCWQLFVRDPHNPDNVAWSESSVSYSRIKSSVRDGACKVFYNQIDRLNHFSLKELTELNRLYVRKSK